MAIRRAEPNCAQVCDCRGADGVVRRIGDVRQSRSSNGEVLQDAREIDLQLVPLDGCQRPSLSAGSMPFKSRTTVSP